MPINAGDLDRRITIQRFTETRDELNNPVPAWQNLATVSASKRDVSDKERLASQEVGAEITTRFVIRYSSTVSSVNAKDRVLCEGRIYEISAVKEIGHREALEISATARSD